MSANSSSTLARWTDEEHQILVQLTNDQIELESQDHTQEISWAEHWRKVSARLRDSGYNRTSTACQSYWKRVVENQKANEEAAGPRWDDSEHQILLGMTEDQLALEREDASAVIPWPKHWKRVSLRLQENGYNRTPNSCAAYWLTVGYDFSVDNYEPMPEMPKAGKPEFAKDEVVVELGADSEEQPSTSNQANEDDPLSRASKDGPLQPEELPEPRTILLSNATSIFTPSITPAPSEKDPSEDESYQPRQREYAKSKMSRTPTRTDVTPPKPRSPKLHMRRSFRFSAEQRAILEAQVERHGPYPDSDRRYELARDLGVEEKTIRNWFIHRRTQKGQNIAPGMNTPESHNHDDSIVSQEHTPGSAPPDSSMKRRPFAVASTNIVPSTPEDTGDHNVKRLRLESDRDHGFHENPRMNTNGSQRGFGLRQSSGSSISMNQSRKSSIGTSSAGRESAATSMSFSPVNMTTARHQPTGELPIQTFEGVQQDDHRPAIEKSSSLPNPVSGADWNPINSARSKEFEPASLVSTTSTPTPTAHMVSTQFNSSSNQHPYGIPVSATPPPALPSSLDQRSFQQQPLSASPPPPQNPSPNIKSTTNDTSSEKEWMASKVASFQTSISTLNADKAALLHRISLLDQRLDDVTHEENALEEAKENEILEAVRQIEERYRGRGELIRNQQKDLAQAREREVEGLQRNGADLKRRKAALEHFQALVGLYDEE